MDFFNRKPRETTKTENRVFTIQKEAPPRAQHSTSQWIKRDQTKPIVGQCDKLQSRSPGRNPNREPQERQTKTTKIKLTAGCRRTDENTDNPKKKAPPPPQAETEILCFGGGKEQAEATSSTGTQTQAPPKQ